VRKYLHAHDRDPRSRRQLAIVEGEKKKRIELPHDEEDGRHIITEAEVGTLATHFFKHWKAYVATWGFVL
jgi:hypothetical protein